MSNTKSLHELLVSPEHYAVLDGALSEYRALVLGHCDAFADMHEVAYFERMIRIVDELRAALEEG
ncbi:hypothetical protein BOH66_15265 [Microbacterium aurum]|uniref:Uncharacterized protein n=1 Tax=Microbacterium aurum TaxID=36805 RepID=A0A1P8UBG0_9MICO|nr:hypothetical protein BOH66_15265 [Microbacterium aurum]